MIETKIEFLPRSKDDKKPFVASIKGDGFEYHAQAPTQSEALLLLAAHWHARAHFNSLS